MLAVWFTCVSKKLCIISFGTQISDHLITVDMAIATTEETEVMSSVFFL